MTDILTNDIQVEAKLINKEDELSRFIFLNIESENNTFTWPTNKLPEGIEEGETVILTIDFKNKQDRIASMKKKKEDESKNEEVIKKKKEKVRLNKLSTIFF